MSDEIDLSDMNKIISVLQKMGPAGDAAADEALHVAAKIVQVAMRIKVYKVLRYRTGTLGANIKIGDVWEGKNGKSIVVGIGKGDVSKAFYGKFHEYGWTPLRKGQTSSARHRENIADKKASDIEYGNSKTNAHPFQRPAFEETKEIIAQTMEKIFIDAIQKEFTK